MRKSLMLLLSLLLLLPVALPAQASELPFFASPASRDLLINLVSIGGEPVNDAEIQLLTPGQTGLTTVRTDSQGQASLEVPDGFSFWLRIWAKGYALIERPYVPASDGPVLTLQATPYGAFLTGVVRDQRGLPVARAQIQLYRAGFGLEATAMTNDLGIYTLSNLRAEGEYTLQARAVGYRPISQPIPAFDPQRRNQVDLALTPAEGRLTGEVVADKSNRPIGGVRVELLLNNWGRVAQTTTDSLGYFDLAAPPLENGVYQLRLSRHDYETITTGSITLSPGGWTDFSGANRITLNRLYAQISGKLFDANANAMEKVEIQLQRQGLGTVESTTTDAQGRYRFSQVPAGSYRVRALPKGSVIHPDSGWLNVTGGQDLTANLVASTPDTGGYGLENLAGTVKNHQGEPVEGAKVTIQRGSQTYTETTDAEGRYDLNVQSNISTDPTEETYDGYHVLVTADGYLANDQPSGSDGEPASLVNVRKGTDNQANFTLQPEFDTVAGRVMDDQGRPLAGVLIGLLQEGRQKVAEVKTDSAGRYRFDKLPVAKQSRYLPVVLDAAYVTGAVNPSGAPIDPANLAPAEPTNITLVARPSQTTMIGLVQAGDDRPAAGATVTVLRPNDDQRFTAQVGEDGSYKIEVPATPGEQYLLQTSGEGAVANAATEVVSPGTDFGATVNLTSHVSARITGRIFGADGRPFYGAKVMLYAEGSSSVVKIAFTNTFGQYRFDDLVPGQRYAVIASDGWYERTAIAPGEPVITPLIALPSGETRWADLNLNALPLVTP